MPKARSSWMVALGALLLVFAVALVSAAAASRVAAARQPTLSVTSPAGGEIWQTGTTHTIAWATRHVPRSYKVSVTIRRVPPPPLPAEGQEFDPVLFVNQPNSGTLSWDISGQYPSGTYLIAVHAYPSLPMTKQVSAESAPLELVHPPSAALYPLYPGPRWGAPQPGWLALGKSTVYGSELKAVAARGTMNPGAAFQPFVDYYAKQLTRLGWQQDRTLAANGPASGILVYRKVDAMVVVGFSTVFHNVSTNAPEQCPCDVSLSLLSVD